MMREWVPVPLAHTLVLPNKRIVPRWGQVLAVCCCEVAALLTRPSEPLPAKSVLLLLRLVLLVAVVGGTGTGLSTTHQRGGGGVAMSEAWL